MKHKNFTTRAELLRAAADSIEMQEQAGVEPMCKYQGAIEKLEEHGLWDLRIFEFPLAVVEGKQVWEGDKLWHKDGTKYIVEAVEDCAAGLAFRSINQNSDGDYVRNYSWNPPKPKPKTVMVVLRREVAEYFAARECDQRSVSEEVTLACRNALEELK